MNGGEFLTKYDHHNDPVTVIDKKRSYGVKAATRHPIYENFRVKVGIISERVNYINGLSFIYQIMIFVPKV